jgi:hypothetical protein
MNIDYTEPLTEEFIREFQNKINWNLISITQDLSESFIIEFQNKINFVWLIEKFGYEVFVENDKYCIKYDNNFSNFGYLEYPEFVNLAIRLISLKSFQ